jgi:pyrroline-5-carboxylate reductase
VVSIMAGVRIAQLSRRLETQRIICSMPNTPGSIGQGITVYSAAPGLAAADLDAATSLLAPLGDVHGPVDESLMSAVTALSGSGPAYLFLLAESMAEAGESEGLPRALAQRLARRTIEGAAALMAASGDDPESLRRAVTSPGGTTQAALDILMDTGGMPRLLRDALRAAAARDRQLSKEAD